MVPLNRPQLLHQRTDGKELKSKERRRGKGDQSSRGVKPLLLKSKTTERKCARGKITAKRNEVPVQRGGCRGKSIEASRQCPCQGLYPMKKGTTKAVTSGLGERRRVGGSDKLGGASEKVNASSQTRKN